MNGPGHHIRFLSYLLILCVCISVPENAFGDDYLSAGEMAAIAGGSAATGYIGYRIRHGDGFKTPLIGGPFPCELPMMGVLAGKYHRGKTNFLDDRWGSALTPVALGMGLLIADFTWPQSQPGKDVGQDLFLFASGLIATKGLTDLSKGISRRPRPYTLFEDSSRADSGSEDVCSCSSFFSGHSASSFFSAAFTNLRIRSIMRQRLTDGEYRDWRWASPTILFGWAGYVAWSRLHAYKHYPTDILVGALVGYVVAELFYSWAYERQDAVDGNGSPLVAFRISFSF